jgi:endoglucanase
MNPKVSDKLMRIADRKSIPRQLAASGRASPNDANSIQINRAGVATGLVSIPNRYMHSAVETISLLDLDHAADLLAEFVAAVTLDEDFIP